MKEVETVLFLYTNISTALSTHILYQEGPQGRVQPSIHKIPKIFTWHILMPA